MVACLPPVQQVRGSIPDQVVNFHLTIFNLGARRGGDVHFLIARLYITGLVEIPNPSAVYMLIRAASWRKRLDARLPPLGSRVRVSVTPYGFRGGRNEIWVGFSRGFSRFSLPQISFHHFSTLISSISFHFIRPCDGASGMVGRHPCYSRTYNVGTSSHLIPRADLVLDTS